MTLYSFTLLVYTPYIFSLVCRLFTRIYNFTLSFSIYHSINTVITYAKALAPSFPSGAVTYTASSASFASLISLDKSLDLYSFW